MRQRTLAQARAELEKINAEENERVRYSRSPEGQAEREKFRREVFGPHPDLATLSYDQLLDRRDRLLAISNARHAYALPMPREPMAVNGTLTLTEQARLENIVHTINVHHGVRFLQGRSHTDFGFDGVDQVHGNEHRKECGCILTVVFDHHQRHANPTLHEHYPRRLCAAHTV